jgi:hypothetical protein
VPVAEDDRIIEAELGAQRHPDLGRHVRVGGKLAERVARRQRQHDKQHDADAEQARHQDQQAAEQVVVHLPR